MDPSTWSPHGFISKPGLESMYLAAQNKVVDEVVLNPAENKTTKLFNQIFGTSVFRADQDYSCAPGQPPSAHSSLRCDFVIESLTTDLVWQVLCFAVARTSSHEGGLTIEALEQQAMEYCQEFLRANEDLEQICAITLVGASIRCWLCQRGENKLQGFWNSDKNGSFGYYLDVGLDKNKPILDRAFDTIKAAKASQMPLGMNAVNTESFNRRCY